MNPPSLPTAPAVRHPFWSVWSNPIFLRYCRSRMRPAPLGIWLLLTLLIAGFFVALSVAIGSRTHYNPMDAARGPIIPLFFLQGIILFAIGTAQASGGMTAERDEGVIDYQRLIPMSPLAKVLGYLFGLPVREYVLFLATMPFMAWCLWRGEVSWQVWLPLYVVLFTTTILYHLTGLLTGTAVRNRRWAFLTSIGLVLLLYTVIPQLAKFGLVSLNYLTISPVFGSLFSEILPRDLGSMMTDDAENSATRVRFFHFNFSPFTFTLFAQGGFILVMCVMLCRKWRRHESHLLDKLWAVGFFGWLQLLFLGSALPLVQSGRLFPSRELQNRFIEGLPWQPDPSEALALVSIYGIVTLLLLLAFATIITPTPERQFQGWRRARKLGLKRIPPLTDAGSAWWFALAMAAIGGAGWFAFARGTLESHWFPEQSVPLMLLAGYCGLLAAITLACQSLLETRGTKMTFLAAIVIGVVPLMVGSILCIVSEALYPIGIWVLGISPLVLPVYSADLLKIVDLPTSISNAVPQAFYFWTAAISAAAIWLTFNLVTSRKTMAKATLAVSEPPGIE